MSFGSLENLGRTLAECRRLGRVADLRLERITAEDEAEAVRDEAVLACGSSLRGYRVAATSALARRLLGCEAPVWAPLLAAEVRPGGTSFRLPPGVIGAGCELAFVMARPYPLGDEEVSRASAGRAVAACRPGIGILGRRVPGSKPLNALTATADFGLGVAYVDGPDAGGWEAADLATVPVTALIDGQLVAAGRGGHVLGHPLEAVAWLARALARRGGRLDAGDLVATGTCAGLLQVLPGQTFAADFGGLGRVEVRLE